MKRDLKYSPGQRFDIDSTDKDDITRKDNSNALKSLDLVDVEEFLKLFDGDTLSLNGLEKLNKEQIRGLAKFS